MVTIEIEIVTLVGITGLSLSILNFLYTYWRTSRGDIKEYENRLTKLEECQFKEADRKCLNQLEIKMSLFWNIVEREFPKMLQQANTPRLDIMLSKIRSVGFSKLTKEEAQETYNLLNEQYEEISRNEDKTDRKIVLAFLKGALALQWSLITPETQLCSPPTS